jgi:hypothetical protein
MKIGRGSVGCRGGSGTVHVGQWRRSTLCTRQSNSGPNTVLYIDQPTLKMGNRYEYKLSDIL